MEQKRLSIWLKAVVIGFAICGILFYAVVLPSLSADLAERFPELAGLRLPWLILLWITGLPCFAALILAYLIFDHIGREHSFVKENATALRLIACLAFIDSGALLAGSIIFAAVGLSVLALLELSVLVSFIGAAIGVAALALSKLTEKAIQLRTENEAYI
jgi:hypothetical protein